MLALVSVPYVLRKLMTFAVLPLGIVLTLLVAALAFGKKKPLLAAVILLYLGSTPFVGDRLIGILESQYPRLTVAACPQTGAVVVLGGLVSDWDGDGRIEFNDAVDRFNQAVRLVQAGKAPLLVLSGGRLLQRRDGSTEGDAMRAAAEERGIPAAKIRVIRAVAVTADEAAGVARLATKERIGRVILVTSAFHMARAVYLFKKAGLEVVPFPVDYRAQSGQPVTAIDFAPQAGGLMKTEIAIKEFYGLLFYHLAG